MKLTKNQLRKLIKEELSKALSKEGARDEGTGQSVFVVTLETPSEPSTVVAVFASLEDAQNALKANAVKPLWAGATYKVGEFELGDAWGID